MRKVTKLAPARPGPTISSVFCFVWRTGCHSMTGNPCFLIRIIKKDNIHSTVNSQVSEIRNLQNQSIYFTHSSRMLGTVLHSVWWLQERLVSPLGTWNRWNVMCVLKIWFFFISFTLYNFWNLWPLNVSPLSCRWISGLVCSREVYYF